MYLQVSLVADIATADGKQLRPEILVCERITHRTTKWEWPNQPKPSHNQQNRIGSYQYKDTFLLMALR